MHFLGWDPFFLGICTQVAGLTYELLVGVVANGLTLLLVVLIRFFSKAWNVRCLRFFGVQKRRRLNVYYGCIPVGTNLVGARESQETNRFAELFQLRIPGLGDGDSLLKTIFLAAVRVHGIASCPGTHVTLGDSLITLGSPMYSVASGVFEKELESRIYLRDNAIHLPGGNVVQDSSQAVIVKKCRDGLAYFYAAGADEPGTLTASRYLAEHWKELAEKYPGQQSFFVLLRSTPGHDKVVVVSESPLE
jgi:hypothetical protein